MPEDQAPKKPVVIIEKASPSVMRERLAFRRQLAETDRISRLEGSLKQGRAEGVAEGRAKVQTEVARRMLQKNMPLSDIVAMTDLSEADVKRLAAEEKA